MFQIVKHLKRNIVPIICVFKKTLFVNIPIYLFFIYKALKNEAILSEYIKYIY